MIQKFVILIISCFDFFYQKKIINFLKKNIGNNFPILIDVGAHKGETIDLFAKNFNIKKIISFEASPISFNYLQKKIISLNKKYRQTEIILENLALGSENKDSEIKHLFESSSSTINEINHDSTYFKKKYKILNLFSKKKLYETLKIKITKLSEYFNQNNLEKIDFLKIDTEGYEYEVLKGLEDKIIKVRFIMFEHHYDDMIKKNYTFGNMCDLLKMNNFKMIYKSKMPFRKTFEYIYINNHFDY